jgi:hypothetical protein
MLLVAVGKGGAQHSGFLPLHHRHHFVEVIEPILIQLHRQLATFSRNDPLYQVNGCELRFRQQLS